MRKSLVLILLMVGGTACGVKGRPQPPLHAPPIGRGKPTLNSNQKFLKLSPLVAPTEEESPK